MAISLKKGQRIDLTKGNGGLRKIMVGLGWDVNQFDKSVDFDLDASIFLAGGNGKCTKDEDFVFYNNLTGGNGSVVHTGDNLTGDGDGDDEVINVSLPDVPSDIEKIVVTITIHDAESRRQNFGQVSNAFVRIVDEESATELMRFDLGEDFSVETSVVAGEIYRHGGEWKFNAIGAGEQGGLDTLCKLHGLQV